MFIGSLNCLNCLSLQNTNGPIVFPCYFDCIPIVFVDRCIPRYWKLKDMSNLSDSKKREANDLNKNILSHLSKEFDYLCEGRSGDGQLFVKIGLVSI